MKSFIKITFNNPKHKEIIVKLTMELNSDVLLIEKDAKTHQYHHIHCIKLLSINESNKNILDRCQTILFSGMYLSTNNSYIPCIIEYKIYNE